MLLALEIPSSVSGVSARLMAIKVKLFLTEEYSYVNFAELSVVGLLTELPHSVTFYLQLPSISHSWADWGLTTTI